MAQKRLLLTFLLVFWPWFSVFAAPADSADPYNSYLWNRDNALAHNGRSDRGDWFEWWYFKVVDPASHEAFFFTYGVINPWDLQTSLSGSRAVIQVGDFKNNLFAMQELPVDQFASSYDKTEVHVGSNLATDQHIQGQMQDPKGHKVSWDFSIEKNWAFDAMGWAMTIPELSGIYWYPAQASATMTGWIIYDGRRVDFKNAPAYQDRNWGRSFPKWWTWLTSNHFKNSPGTVLAAGGGQPKIFDIFYMFQGLCIGLKYNGKEYIFRTTDLDRIQFNIHWGVWNVEGRNSRNQKIVISAYAPPEKFLMLPFLSPQGPTFYDYEALLGQMTVQLYEWSSHDQKWNTIADLETDDAGIEWGTPHPVGSTERLSLRSLFNSTIQLQ